MLGAPSIVAQSGKKRHIKLRNPRDTVRVSLGHPAGQTGVCRLVSQGFPVVYYSFARTPARCPRDTGPSKVFFFFR